MSKAHGPTRQALPAPGATRALRRYVAAWTVGAIVVGGVTAAAGANAGAPDPSPAMFVLLLVASALAGLPHATIRLLPGAGEATTALELAVLPTILLLAPQWALVVVLLATLVSETILTPREPLKIAFNVSTKVVAAALASAVHHTLTGPSFTGTPTDLAVALAAALALVATGSLAFSGLVTRASGRPWRAVIREDARSGVPIDLGIAVTGVLAAVLWVRDPFALPLLAVPVLLDHVRVRARTESLELAAARDRAQAASRAKSDFLSHMSHELRTPLNGLLGFAQLLQRSDLDRDDRDSVARILRAGNHLLHLIDDVLDFARIEAGVLDVQVRPMAARVVVDDAVDMLQPQLRGRDLSLSVSLPDPTLTILGDPQRIRQVLINLLSNAAKYNVPGGRIAITCEPATEPGWQRLAVADTGRGIAPDLLPRLFISFDRLDADRRDRDDVEGTGLGLALSKRLVEAMGGRIGCTSQLHAGSTFWIELPEPEHDVSASSAFEADGGPAGTWRTTADATQALAAGPPQGGDR